MNINANNYWKIFLVLLFYMLLFVSCITRKVRTIDIVECINNRPSPYQYAELTTRYTEATLNYHIQDTSAVYKIILPKNYRRDALSFTNGQFDSGITIYYDYNCSYIYFSPDFLYSANSVNIKTQYPDTNYIRFKYPRFLDNEIVPSTMVLEGIDTNGFYWKDVRFEWVCYGYKNVKGEDKAIFDSIVGSIKRIK